MASSLSSNSFFSWLDLRHLGSCFKHTQLYKRAYRSRQTRQQADAGRGKKDSNHPVYGVTTEGRSLASSYQLMIKALPDHGVCLLQHDSYSARLTMQFSSKCSDHVRFIFPSHAPLSLSLKKTSAQETFHDIHSSKCASNRQHSFQF